MCWIIYPFIYFSIFVFFGYFCGGENGCRARVPRGSPLLTFVRCLCYFSITLVFSFPRAHLAERMEPILDFLKYSRCLDSLDLVKKRNKENKEQLARGGGGKAQRPECRRSVCRRHIRHVTGRVRAAVSAVHGPAGKPGSLPPAEAALSWRRRGCVAPVLLGPSPGSPGRGRPAAELRVARPDKVSIKMRFQLQRASLQRPGENEIS